MENEQPSVSVENRCGPVSDNSTAQADEVNKENSSDNENDTGIKEESLHPGESSAISMNLIGDDNNKPRANMSVYNYCKEDSDLSDFGDESNRCQLTSDALRAKLINSVINQGTQNDSKLRVSVFDHRNIPKEFIRARNRENRTDNGADETVLETRKLGLTNGANNQNTINRGRGPCAVFRANRRTSSSSSCGQNGETGSTMDKRNSDYRTRFDILLRKLIGDVDDMQVEPSPMTVSSGYESDYVQTHETENSTVFNKNSTEDTQNKENVAQKENDSTLDYFSMSETYPDQPVNTTSLSQSHAFSSLPTFPTQEEETIRITESKEMPQIRNNGKSDRDSGRFSYAQRHNYKLTKVTRNMYEIIHDLQNGEKAPVDGRKRSRKSRRSTQDGISGSDGNASSREIKPRGRFQSCDFTLDNNTPLASFQKNRETNIAAISGAVVRCVRRPLGGDSAFRPAQRKPSYSENNNRLATSCANSNCDKVQNDLRNLLCSTSDVTLSSADNNEPTGDFNMLSSVSNNREVLGNTINSHVDNGFNHVNVSINRTQDTVDSPRRPTLTEQFSKRTKPDDHVYETIPGDEKLYEEWKKMRATSKVPRIRRFTTVPDLPGTFVPKDPPALPARKYLSSNQPQQKENDNYIVMGDTNSNEMNRNPSERSEAGYASVAADQMLDPRWFQCYPYPIPDDGFPHHNERVEETSDGYCSIDNISLLNGSLDVPLPERNWHVTGGSSMLRAPTKTDNIPPPVRNRRNLNGFNSFSNHFDHGRPFGHDFPERRLPSRTESDSMVLSTGYERENGKQVFQATYV